MDDQDRQIVMLVGGVFLVVLMWSSFYVVAPGHVGVRFSRVTESTKTTSQGMGLKLPILHGIYKFDVRTQRLDITAEGASKDLQAVTLHIALNYHLTYEKVNDLFVKVGPSYDTNIIEPAVNEAIKAASSQFPVEEIIVKRQDLKKQIEERLVSRLSQYHINIESLNIVDIDFAPEFNKVVEEKQIEEQKIKTAEYQRRQAEEYKKKTILEAEAEAEKQRLMKNTLTPDLVAMKWIEKWNGQLPTTVLGDKNVMMVNPK